MTEKSKETIKRIAVKGMLHLHLNTILSEYELLASDLELNGLSKEFIERFDKWADDVDLYLDREEAYKKRWMVKDK